MEQTALLTITAFPFRLIEHFMKREVVEFVTMGEMADESKSKNPPVPGALMPVWANAMLHKRA